MSLDPPIPINRPCSKEQEEVYIAVKFFAVKFSLPHYLFCRTTVLLPGTVLKAVLRNRNYFLRFRFRFRLLTSYGSDSGSSSGSAKVRN